MACIPFGLIDPNDEDENKTKGDYNNLLRLLRLPRLYRLLRISRVIKMFKHYKNSDLIEKISDYLSLKHSVLRLCGSFVTIIVLIHIISCFWYYSSRIEGFHP